MNNNMFIQKNGVNEEEHEKLNMKKCHELLDKLMEDQEKEKLIYYLIETREQYKAVYDSLMNEQFDKLLESDIELPTRIGWVVKFRLEKKINDIKNGDDYENRIFHME